MRSFFTNLIKRRRSDGESRTDIKIVLLPSKLTESDDSVLPKERRLWQLFCFLHSLSKMSRVTFVLFMPLTLFWIYVTASATVEVFGIASLFRTIFVLKLLNAGFYTMLASLLFAAFFSLISITPKVESPMPDTLFLSEDGFALWEPSFLIPWDTIHYAHTKSLIYRGALRTTVLELLISKPKRGLWQQIKNLAKIDGTNRNIYYLDPESNRIPENPELDLCLRIPLELFAFDNERGTFLASLREHIPPEIYHCEIESEVSGITADGFTRLWLQDLRSEAKPDLTRVLLAGRELKESAYKITGVLGYGGFSVVYSALARQNLTELRDTNKVAIKEIVLNSGGTRASKEAIFKQVISEVDILKKLDHPNIVKYLDLFVENGKVYVVLEAVVSPNLRELIGENGSWSEEVIIRAAIECCSILEYLHNRPTPIIHRDFTPDNLILDRNSNSIKLIDFNVAEEANSQISQTIVGKQSFMAPEQWCGQFTTAGDFYQLGCTLYFLAMAEEPEALTQADPTTNRISNELRAIIRKLTERDPSNRYGNAREIARDLLNLQAKGEIKGTAEVQLLKEPDSLEESNVDTRSNSLENMSHQNSDSTVQELSR